MKRIVLASLACVVLAACTGESKEASAPAAPAVVTENDLLTHRFELAAINGEAFAAREGRTPEIFFDQGMMVSGSACNRFRGKGEVKDGKLVVKEMASTMMMCADDTLNTLERDISAMLAGGAALSLQDGSLTVEGNGVTLTYKKSDAAQ